MSFSDAIEVFWSVRNEIVKVVTACGDCGVSPRSVAELESHVVADDPLGPVARGHRFDLPVVVDATRLEVVP
ncbi:MAG: hypothetical protein AAGA99_22435 [Actinomycetota bacterium]